MDLVTVAPYQHSHVSRTVAPVEGCVTLIVVSLDFICTIECKEGWRGAAGLEQYWELLEGVEGVEPAGHSTNNITQRLQQGDQSSRRHCTNTFPSHSGTRLPSSVSSS